MRYWLMKSEPDEFSIDDLERQGHPEPWDGVRNYQARNFMRDKMKVGDQVLFYHSNANPSGVAGVAEVVKKAYPDPTAFDPADKHYDPKSKPEAPTWYLVEVGFVERFPDIVPLADLKANRALSGMAVRKKGQRLSVQPVAPRHFNEVVRMGRGEADEA